MIYPNKLVRPEPQYSISHTSGYTFCLVIAMDAPSPTATISIIHPTAQIMHAFTDYSAFFKLNSKGEKKTMQGQKLLTTKMAFWKEMFPVKNCTQEVFTMIVVASH